MAKSCLSIEQATQALAAREPIFHRPEFGTTRADFEAMVADEFREVGASGRTYSKAQVLDVLEARHSRPVEEDFSVSDFACRQVARDLYLVTYALDQSGRLSRRSTLWRLTGPDWKIVYHQGTLVTA